MKNIRKIINANYSITFTEEMTFSFVSQKMLNIFYFYFANIGGYGKRKIISFETFDIYQGLYLKYSYKEKIFYTPGEYKVNSAIQFVMPKQYREEALKAIYEVVKNYYIEYIKYHKRHYKKRLFTL